VVLFVDETDLRLFPPLRAAWAPRGRQAHVPLTGSNAKQVVWGALNPRTGHRLLWFRTRQRALEFQEFLRRIRRHYPGKYVVLLLDEDSSHTAHASRRTAAQLGIELRWLPNRSPHLNPVDHLWRDAKQTVCANRQERYMLHLVRRFILHVERLTPRQALRKAGVLSPAFWLRAALCKNFCPPT
jgi:transposase